MTYLDLMEKQIDEMYEAISCYRKHTNAARSLKTLQWQYVWRLYDLE